MPVTMKRTTIHRGPASGSHYTRTLSSGPMLRPNLKDGTLQITFASSVGTNGSSYLMEISREDFPALLESIAKVLAGETNGT